MLQFNQNADENSRADHFVALPYHQRIKARQKIHTKAGVPAGIFIERGNVLQDGQKLADSTGQVLEIEAEAEQVSVATADSQLLFARACYHVGNRHAEVQIEESSIIYLQDHVMDEMLLQLGLQVSQASLPFTPENGAYSGGHGHHHGDHSHTAMKHEHEHEHEHD